MRVVEKGDWSVKLSVNLRHQLVSGGDAVDSRQVSTLLG